MSTPVTAANWATPQYKWPEPTSAGTTTDRYVLPEYDGRFAITSFDGNGMPAVMEVLAPVYSGAEDTATNAVYYGGRAFFGEGSGAFAMSQSLETSNGMEIAGLNAEEQSDISLTARWSHSQGVSPTTNMVFFVYYDALLVLYENNVVQLIE